MSQLTWLDAAAEVRAFAQMNNELDAATVAKIADHLARTAQLYPATFFVHLTPSQRDHEYCRSNDGLD